MLKTTEEMVEAEALAEYQRRLGPEAKSRLTHYYKDLMSMSSMTFDCEKK